MLLHTYVSINHYVLQVTVSRDSSSNDYSLDAGALVLADQGWHICIEYTYVSIQTYIAICNFKIRMRVHIHIIYVPLPYICIYVCNKHSRLTKDKNILYEVRHMKNEFWLGCCCIDEFDKMGNQHQALLEAMVYNIMPGYVSIFA